MEDTSIPCMSYQIDRDLADCAGDPKKYCEDYARMLSANGNWPKGWEGGEAIVSGPVPAVDFSGRLKGYEVYHIEIRGKAVM